MSFAVAFAVLLIAKIDPAIGLFFAVGAEEAPVVVELVEGPVRARFLPRHASRAALEVLAADPAVKRVHADGSPFASPPPLAATAAEVEAPAVWATGGLSGAGITLCAVDSGVDVFHPLLFRADGGYFAWGDRDGDGGFGPGVDGVILDGTSVTLRALDAVLFEVGGGPPVAPPEAAFRAGLDWLYADRNDNGRRDFGREAGFDDQHPGLGEPLFAADDVDGDGVLDRGEKIVRLGSSKIRVVFSGEERFERGVNLVDAPRLGSAHGTAVASILVGGEVGLTRLVGLAPGADLVSAIIGGGTSQLHGLTEGCLGEGARVVLHEYAPWQGFFLDGSSPLEQLIDATSAAGVAHVNPAGNLAGADKLYKRTVPGGEVTAIAVEVPEDEHDYRLFALSLLWREPGRALGFALVDGAGHARALPDMESYAASWHDGLFVYAIRETSERGTERLDVYVFAEDLALPIPRGSWRIEVDDAAGSGDLTLIAAVQDGASGWGRGIYFPDHASEAHLIGHPGTADGAITVAAYAHHGHYGGEPGHLAPYSGRGRRIDGAPLLSVAAPEDPIAATFREEAPAALAPFGGTSGASPHVAAVAALAFEKRPEATGLEVRAAIRAGADADAVVGAAPNDDWGHGKLRAHRALFGVEPPSGASPTLVVDPLDAAEGIAIEVKLRLEPDLPGSVIEIDRDYDGTYDAVIDRSFWAVPPRRGLWVMKLRATDEAGRTAVALARLEVRSAWVPSGGCSIAPVEGTSKGPLGLLWLGAMLRRRRRRAR